MASKKFIIHAEIRSIVGDKTFYIKCRVTKDEIDLKGAYSRVKEYVKQKYMQYKVEVKQLLPAEQVDDRGYTYVLEIDLDIAFPTKEYVSATSSTPSID